MMHMGMLRTPAGEVARATRAAAAYVSATALRSFKKEGFRYTRRRGHPTAGFALPPCYESRPVINVPLLAFLAGF